METAEERNNVLQCSTPLQGIECDENGLPVGYTVEEVTNRLNQELIDFYGEDIRKMVNEARVKWEKKYSWRFDPL